MAIDARGCGLNRDELASSIFQDGLLIRRRGCQAGDNIRRSALPFSYQLENLVVWGEVPASGGIDNY